MLGLGLAVGCSVVMGDLPEAREERAGSPESVGGNGAAAAGSGTGGKATGGSSQPGGGTAGCDPCDCDGDGVKTTACQGADCNDADPSVRPGQSEYFLEASPGHGFDYDCSNGVEYEKPVGLDCSAVTCNEEAQAFIGHPACGTVDAAWGRCVLEELVQCNPTALSYQPVKCR